VLFIAFNIVMIWRMAFGLSPPIRSLAQEQTSLSLTQAYPRRQDAFTGYEYCGELTD